MYAKSTVIFMGEGGNIYEGVQLYGRGAQLYVHSDFSGNYVLSATPKGSARTSRTKMFFSSLKNSNARIFLTAIAALYLAMSFGLSVRINKFQEV